MYCLLMYVVRKLRATELSYCLPAQQSQHLITRENSVELPLKHIMIYRTIRQAWKTLFFFNNLITHNLILEILNITRLKYRIVIIIILLSNSWDFMNWYNLRWSQILFFFFSNEKQFNFFTENYLMDDIFENLGLPNSKFKPVVVSQILKCL